MSALNVPLAFSAYFLSAMLEVAAVPVATGGAAAPQLTC
jgi:hypothetical protein